MERFEYSVRYQIIRDNRPGPRNFRYFGAARDALNFASKFGSLDAPPAIVEITRRPIGTWEKLTVQALEDIAASEFVR